MLMVIFNNPHAIGAYWASWLTICCTLIAHYLDALESTLLPCQMDKMGLSDQITTTLSLTYF